MKKLLSVILAIVMLASCAALSLQAFAATDEEISRIDIDFTCDPKEGEKVGSDYTLSLTGYTPQESDTSMFYYPITYATNQEELLQRRNDGEYNFHSLIVITKDDDAIVYPKLDRTIYYAPKRAKTITSSDPDANKGSGAVYEAGSKYNYYLAFGTMQNMSDSTDFYLNGSPYSFRRDHNSRVMYYNDGFMLYFLGSRYISKDVDTVNITFSCNPVNGAPVGSDYNIDVNVTADQAGDKELTVSGGEPLIHCPSQYDDNHNYGRNTYNSSLVAIYESNTLLYPGYVFTPIYYAPARKTTGEAHGSDPTGELGVATAVRDDQTVSTPAFYETGKTYQYYATIEVADSNYYHFTDNTEVFVNGIKVTDFTKSDNGIYLQVPVATVTCAHVHDMTYHAAVAATVDAEGNVAYYHCEGCGKNFADEAGTQEIANVVIDKLPNTEPHTDPATEPTTEPAQGDDVCAYCGKVHTGPFAGLTRFFHRIILFFRNIFKR